MSRALEEWLERMTAARKPGPAVRVTAARNHRDVGWAFDLVEDSNLGELAERIDNACRDAGFAGTYELRAVDAEGRFIAPFSHKIESTQLVTYNQGASGLAPHVEEATGLALKSHRSFAGLGLQAINSAHNRMERIIGKLETENERLHAENEKLRGRIADTWEMLHKLHTNEAEHKIEVDKSERMGRMAETFVQAGAARLFGPGPEAASIHHRLLERILRSIAQDPERAQKIMEPMTDDERLGLMEVMRGQAAAAQTNGAPLVKATDANAAAAAAASVNGKAASS